MFKEHEAIDIYNAVRANPSDTDAELRLWHKVKFSLKRIFSFAVQNIRKEKHFKTECSTVEGHTGIDLSNCCYRPAALLVSLC